MSSAAAANVAVIGGGISGAVCASLLAARGVAVTLFDSGRGAGGRMAQRREVMEDGTELRFDHGAPYFTVTNDEVSRVVSGWEARGIVAEWKAMFACFDQATGKFTDFEKVQFHLSLFPRLSVMVQDIPVRPCFALMVPVHGFSFNNSDSLSWAFCDSSKPGRACVPPNRQSWILHSTTEYASKVINIIGLRKPSADALAKVAEELFREFQATGLSIPQPIFMKAHRWGSAFPAISIGGDDKCVWDKSTKLAICGDFCASPSVEGAVLSAMRGASKILGCLNCPSGL
ncbi:hypothetical protein BAE44_0015527 [Dichanthelium oligosanthes]|uniref:Amine oxidase domain-containing protein n=1 Tax=Dichanthelium oligosanthes TaxID=888268 RepID=A0A1E5VE84_9POAL|nr:hypothetical protein BAE44_0015527 [Dichanthelium oligosanthes]